MNDAHRFGALRNAADNFELSLGRALSDLQAFEREAASAPGVTIPTGLTDRLNAFGTAANALHLAAFVQEEAFPQFKQRSR